MAQDDACHRNLKHSNPPRCVNYKRAGAARNAQSAVPGGRCGQFRTVLSSSGHRLCATAPRRAPRSIPLETRSGFLTHRIAMSYGGCERLNASTFRTRKTKSKRGRAHTHAPSLCSQITTSE
ncbi:hypothetical protein AAFF_G00146920 [Aldrovandia affinis]|uniref:Uncharacterized protein n=1 Tax=Aldrovandia affinis TaxID=143900 RepID=A0AAD7RPQ6_9TELE|nr:hypothetical protein AAFF_G00146920 [Aldrovandia affinis]